MSTNPINKSEATMDDVLALINDFKTGNFSKELNKTSDPKLKLLVDSLNDVTKILAAQAAQAAQAANAIEDRARIHALFTQSADPIMTLAPPSWKFTSCNPSALKLFGVATETDFVNLGPWDLSPEQQPDGSLSSEKAPAAIMQAMKTGSHFFEWDHKTLSGKAINCTVLLSRVDLGEESYLQATVRDVTQEKLKEYELKSIYSNSPLGIIRLDSNYRYLSANPAYERFLGYTELELRSKSMLDLTHSDDRSKTLEKIQAFPSEGGGTLKRFEKRYLHKSGKTIWGRVTSQAMRNPEGKLTFLSVIEDVTEQKANEIETAAILTTMADGLVMQDKTGAIETFNPAALSILGLNEDQLRGRTSTDPSWKAIKEDGSAFPGEEHPAMIALRTGAPVQGAIMGLVLPDNTERWIKINAIPFEGSAGRRVACTFSDVTELLTSQKEIRFILDALKIGLWKFNPVSQELYWDNSMYEVFEINRADFTGHYQAWESTLTAESKQKAVEELGKALNGEKKFNTVFEINTKTRGKRFISGQAAVIRDQAKMPIMMYGINADVTEQVQLRNDLDLERAKALRSAKLASLGEMSAGIAHEINNPLAIISGSIGLLSKFAQDPDKLTAKIETIKKACDRIARIVGGLRKFSRSGDKSDFKNYELSKIIGDALILTEAKSKRHSTPVTIESKSRTHVLADEIEIEQVLVNLINNAIDAVKDRPEKWVQVSVLDEGDSVVLRVTDSGPGIPENVRNRLFEPFFTTKKIGEGTGLGLSITKGILDEHKATITVVADSPNTCFEIRFPRAEEMKSAA